MKKTLPLTLLFAVITTLGFSQADRFWSASYESRSSITKDKAVARQTFPKEFRLFDLNIEPLRRELFSIVDKSSKRTTVISLPNAAGALEQFEVYESSNFEAPLQARFPEIRAYSGKGITDRSATLKLSISPQGIQTMVFRTEKQNEFIEPYSADHKIYAVFESRREKGSLPWTCSTEEKKYASDLKAQMPVSNITGSSAGELKTMRLAQSCNGEYANWFGATSSAQVALVLAAFNATLTRCNGCYEKDLALHLNLVPETVNVIYYNPATDPYSSMGNWNTELQIALNTTLTGPGTPINVNNAAYDIGHMFGASGGGGNAGCIGCVCVDGVPSGTGATKGRGITSPADGIPQGDNFDIDYVAHEVGHQLGGNHTFTFSNEGTVAQREVGAGITIMGYAGITPYDPAPHSIDIFHAASIDQIQNNLATKSCPITTNISATNHTPVVAPLTNVTIPISTPFILTGSATDADPGDVLTYCWEQYDLHGGQTGANSVAYAAKPVGPNWLTFPAVTSPTRYFPRLSTVQAGLLITPPLPGGDAICNIEALSSVTRTLNFRLTVRDNRPYSSTPPLAVGQTSYADIAVNVTNTAGPFKVTAPNTNVSWPGGSSQTITWDVNNTNTGAVNCANVKISLSTDGGATFPTVISASTANDGTETVTIPSIATTTARIKVEAVGNIFYDMSDVNFSITASNPTFNFVPPASPTSVACASASASATLGTTSVLGFVTPINLAATAGVPGGTNVTFTPNPVVPGNSTVVSLNNMNNLVPGTYNITVTGTAGAEVKTVVITFIVTPGSGPSITAQPNPQTICAGGNTTFSITSAAATSFQWQESTNGGGSWSNITNGGVYSGATTATLTLTGVTAVMNNYQYRCVASVLCGSSNSNAATLTVNAPPSISSQPAASVVCGVASTTFSVTAAGAGLTYQWQSATSCAGPWTNLANAAPYSGVTTATLTVNPTAIAMNGTAYRCVVSGTCAPAVNSNCVTLTVNTPIAITSNPSNSTLCAGLQTSFTVAATGTTPAYQWQESTNGGGTWNNIANGGVYSGATTATLTLTGVTAGMNNYQYRCVVNGAATCTSSNSTAAILTVNTAPSITTQPVAATTLCAGNNITYTVAANGTAPTYQWQISTTGAGGPWTNIVNGGVYSGATTASLTITGVTAGMTGSLYRCVVSGTCTPAATSNNAALTVNTPISITTQPVVTTNICATGSTSFTVAAAGTSPTYQWQISTTGAGGPWTNIANGGVYGGATTTTLTLTGITAAMNGSQYRCVVSGAAPCGAVNSNAGVLNVTPQPVITAAPYTSLLAGWNTTLTVNVTPGPGLTFAWYLNGNQQPETGNTLIATVNRLGDYRVIVSSASGSCQSELLNIKDSASKKLFIYPVPNNGLFTVSYHVPGASATNSTKQQITIYDSYGRRVLNKEYPVSQPYQLHQIDLRRFGGGVYYVVLREANGNKIKTGEVVVK